MSRENLSWFSWRSVLPEPPARDYAKRLPSTWVKRLPSTWVHVCVCAKSGLAGLHGMSKVLRSLGGGVLVSKRSRGRPGLLQGIILIYNNP
eukprot:5399409-Amphidinium_carterae.1